MAKKALLRDHDNIEILPITRGELVLDSSGKVALHSNEFLATDSQPGLMSPADKQKLANVAGNTVDTELSNTSTNPVQNKVLTQIINSIREKYLKSAVVSGNKITLTDQSDNTIEFVNSTYQIVTNAVDGLVPKYDAVDGTIDAQTTDWVLTNHNGTLGWYKLPTTAFSSSSVQLFVGAKSTSNNNNSNSATTNGNTYLKLFDNSTLKNQYNIKGTGLATVISDDSGTITINVPTSHNQASSDINSLAGYAKATAIAAIATSDSLNTALGKLELKADTTYELLKGAYDGDGTIENLAEILKVLEGISDTETIQAIIGKYLPLIGGELTGPLRIKCGADRKLTLDNTDGEKWSLISFREKGEEYGYLGVTGDSILSWNGAVVLNSENYNSYAPTLTGTGASGTWGISISGNAATATTATTSNTSNYLKLHDIRGTAHAPNSDKYPQYAVTGWFNSTGTPDSDWYSGLTVKGWTNDYASWQLCSYSSTGTANDYNLYFRNGNNSTWGSWKTVITSGNIGSQSVAYATSAGSADSATSASYSRNLLGRTTSGTDWSATDGNLVFAEWNTHSDNRWYLKAKGYETRVGYANNSDKLDGIDSTGFLQNYSQNYSSTISNARDISPTLTAGVAQVHISNVEYSSVLTGYDFNNKAWQLRFRPSYNDGIYFRSQCTGTAWKKLAFTSDIPTSLPANGGNADTVDGYHLKSFGHYTNSSSVSNTSGSTWYAKVVLDLNWNATTHYLYCLPVYNNISGWFILEIPSCTNHAGYIAKTSSYNGCNIQGFHYERESDLTTVYLKLVGNSAAQCTVYSTATIKSITSVSAPACSFVSVGGKSFVTNYNITTNNASVYNLNVGNVYRQLYSDSAGGSVVHSILNYSISPYGLLTRIYNDGCVSLQSQRETTSSEYFVLSLNPLGGKVGINKTNPSYTLDVSGAIRATTRIYANEWIQMDNATGLYWPNTYSAHFYPNETSTYGQFTILGSKGSYSGLHFGNTKNYLTVMSTEAHHGLYCEADGVWEFYYNKGNKRAGVLTSSLQSTSALTIGGGLHVDGTIRVVPTLGLYQEGIRIQPYRSWSTFMLLGPDTTAATSGTSAKSWGFFNNDGTLYINKATSNGKGNPRAMATSTGWTFGNTDLNSYALNTASFICASWVRTKGDAGWYNEDYGGGWYMTDSTYVRVYNDKRVYNNNSSQYAFYTAGGMTASGNIYAARFVATASNSHQSNGGLILSNADIWGLNAIYTSDLAESANEGYQFKRTNANYDSIWCKDGTFYFSPNGHPDSGYNTNYYVLHSGNFDGFYYTLIDASSLNNNTWYPVTISIGNSYQTNIRIQGHSSANASWNGRSDKNMAVILDYTVNGSGWGWTGVQRVVHQFQLGAGAGGSNCIAGLGQLTNDSTEYVYVRGGAKYHFYISRNITPVLHTSTYTSSGSQTVGPTTSSPTAIVAGYHDMSLYAPHFYENSDVNLKKNIKAILDSDNIPVIKEFDWKSDGTHSYGLIAQELEEQGYSELVSDSGSHKTVNYSAALSLIVGKLQNKIKELEAEIENLKLRA